LGGLETDFKSSFPIWVPKFGFSHADIIGISGQPYPCQQAVPNLDIMTFREVGAFLIETVP
jgi:hypothetical protein